jgi:archaellum component FlaC
MTVEERFERIEHVTAALAEERRKDREDYRQFWRDTQRQINELTLKIADTNDTVTRLGEKIDRLADESREADRRLGERIDETNRELKARIEALVSAIGIFMSKPSNPQA